MTHRQTSMKGRRRPLPYVILVAALAATAAIAWVAAFTQSPDVTRVACERPGTGEVASATELAGEAAAAPGSIPVRVLNANGEAGQATEVSEGLIDLGFMAAENPVGNDPLIPDQDLDCYGQIRFGAAHGPNGATLHALFPCLELIRDGREDGSVDVALGRGFKGLDDSGPVRAAMTALDAGEEVDSATLQSMSSRTC